MKHSVTLKFIAFILCSLSLVSIIFAGTGIAFMEGYNLYHTPLETIQQEQLNYASATLADYHAQWHAAETLSNAPSSLLSQMLSSHYVNNLGSQYAVEIYDNGQLVYSINSADDLMGQKYDFSYTVTPSYPLVTGEVFPDSSGGTAPATPKVPMWTSPVATEPPIFDYTYPSATEVPIFEYDLPVPTDVPSADYGLPAATEDPAIDHGLPAATEPSATEYAPLPAAEEPEEDAYAAALARVAGQEILYTEEYYDIYYDENGLERQILYSVNYYQAPSYEVIVHLSSRTIMDADYMLVSVLYPYRDLFIPMLLCALVLFITTLVYLFTVAGRRAKGEIHLAAINRIPLDLHLVIAGGVVVVLMLPVIWLFESALYATSHNIWDNPRLCLLICGLCGFGISSTVIGFLYAFAAQIKARDNYWIRHSIIGWCFGMIGKALRWTGSGFSYAFRGCRAVVRMLPVIWQWLLTALAMVFFSGLFYLLAEESYGYGQLFWIFMLFLAVVGSFAVICYGAWCFGILLKGAQRMAQGNLNYQIDTRYLIGCFRDFALQLNALAGAAQMAAERQMKSERMKTELITNVSHDIKSPLTSIINYVDLMKKPHSEEDNAIYLDVLDRQSQRLKKLITDLMDMSKASSGNVTVEIGRIDAVEAVNQALGEFADKLETVHLTPVFRHPEFPVMMQADGRLVWRVLSNILSNAVKYAMPDTRLYVDLMVLQGNAVLAIKNISREQLNVNADELMERFVRGDSSRNTEGSGLGLNIAKSLVELQKGQMHLMVDGDLFKVTLIFPLA